jgi:proline dehydrogenase
VISQARHSSVCRAKASSSCTSFGVQIREGVALMCITETLLRVPDATAV